MYTRHSIERVMERGNKNIREAIMDINRAFYDGSRIDDFSGRELDYLRRKTDDSAYPVVYRNNIYIFESDDVCVTMIPAPKWFGSSVRPKGVKPRSFDIHRYLREYDEGEFAWEIRTAGRLCMS